jgi:threonine dehydrogenase-like Zn-dependent dehydrogenase
MRAIVLKGAPSYETRRPEPRLKSGEALLRVLMAGICNTDLELARGYMGFCGVPGHEFVAMVEAASDAKWIGKRVVGEINCGCGDCELCQGGDARHCARRTVLGILDRDGAFADYFTLPLRNLVEVPAALDTELALFTEPLAAAYEILEQVPVRPGERALVLGDGKLGLLVAQVLATTGADVHVVGKHEAKLDVLRKRGLRCTLRDEWEAGDRYDLTVECTGSAESLAVAVRATRPRGTLVLKTTTADDVKLNVAQLVVDEIRLVGSRCGPFAPALRALEAGTVDVRPLLSARFDLDRGLEALDHAAQKGVLKTVLEVSG